MKTGTGKASRPYLLRRGRGQLASWLGLLLLAFNLVAGIALSASPALARPLADRLDGDRIVICTAAGWKVVDHNGQPVDDGSTVAHEGLCVYCLPLFKAAMELPASLPLVLAWQDAVLPAEPALPLLVPLAPRLSSASAPRAPPFSVFL